MKKLLIGLFMFTGIQSFGAIEVEIPPLQQLSGLAEIAVVTVSKDVLTRGCNLKDVSYPVLKSTEGAFVAGNPLEIPAQLNRMPGSTCPAQGVVTYQTQFPVYIGGQVIEVDVPSIMLGGEVTVEVRQIPVSF